MFLSAVERSDYFTPTEVPEVILRTASGEVSVCETQSYVGLFESALTSLIQVTPLKKFPVKEINEISKKICAQHMQKTLGACRVIRVYFTFESNYPLLLATSNG